MQRALFGFAGLVVALGYASAQDTVDNPQYQEWAKWREGAFVTLKSESVIDGQVQVVTIQTQTLKKLTAEKAVVEYATTTEAGGQTIKAPPMTLDIVARFPKVKVNPTDPKFDPKDIPKFTETKGRETLTISGKKLDCEWHQVEFMGFTTKTWTSDQVPGRLVKMESRSKEATTTMQLTDWKAEKK
jgi:hypothetical protein